MVEPVNKPGIKEIFEKMPYGSGKLSVTEVLEWFGEHQDISICAQPQLSERDKVQVKNRTNSEQVLCDVYRAESTEVNLLLTNQAELGAWSATIPLQRAEIMQKLSTTIGLKRDLVTQIEVVVRGILRKDTHKSLGLLEDLFQYYAGCCLTTQENQIEKPDTVVGIVDSSNPISVFGYILGPSLAAGFNVSLHVTAEFVPFSTLLVELAVEAGIPKGTICVIPGPVAVAVFLNHPNVLIVTIFDDITKDEYLSGYSQNKKLLVFNAPGIPTLLFDDCDLDSACQSIIDAAWGHQGSLPWSVRNVFVQESIFNTFIVKLTDEIRTVQVGVGDEINADISQPSDEVQARLNTQIRKLRDAGVDVVQPKPDSSIPVLAIGFNALQGNVLSGGESNVPILTVTAFRTVNEGIALVNNSKHGMAVSVWSENTGLVQQITDRINTGNIWVNSYNLLAANLPLTPFKWSGIGAFGGAAGLVEYTSLKAPKDHSARLGKSGGSMENAINEAKPAFNSWSKTSRLDRRKVFLAAALRLKDAKEVEVPQKWLADWVQLLFACGEKLPSSGGFERVKNFNVLTQVVPYGVLAIEALEALETHNKKLILGGIFEGNAVIVLCGGQTGLKFYKLLGSFLPKGVLTVVELSKDAMRVAGRHNELSVYFGEEDTLFLTYLKTWMKFRTSGGSWKEVRAKVTRAKNVWYNIGQSFV